MVVLYPALPESALGAVLVLQLAVGDLFERDREVVAVAGDFHHRRRVLAKAALTEAVEVAVYLPCPLGGDDNRRVVGVSVVEELVNAWFDHSAPQCKRPPSRPAD